jgi:DNA-binding response OmpR family regulator
MISRPRVVLLVDDDEDTVEMYALGLSAMGFQPVTATNVDDAFVRASRA